MRGFVLINKPYLCGFNGKENDLISCFKDIFLLVATTSHL